MTQRYDASHAHSRLPMTDAEKQKAVKLYVDHGMTLKMIAARFGRSMSTIGDVFNAAGIRREHSRRTFIEGCGL